MRQLVERLNPSTVTLAYQPGLTSGNGEALRAALPPDTTFLELKTNPYRHGKLIEWSIGGRWNALTGSANLSTAALCRTARTGGNVELGVIAPSAGALLPEGQISSGDRIESVRPVGPTTGRREKAIVLAATLDGQHLVVDLTGPLPTAAVLRVAAASSAPGVWDFDVPVNQGEQRLTIDAVAHGSRVQIAFDDTISNTVFVADPTEILHTANVGSARATTPPPAPIDLFTDPTALGRVGRLLDELRERNLTAGGSGTAMRQGTDAGEKYTVGGWQDFLNVATETLSPQMVSFALGVPGEPAAEVAAIRPIVTRDWDGDDPDLRDDAFEDEDADDVQTENAATMSEYQLVDSTRQRCWRSIERFEPKDGLGALITLRLMLSFVAAGGFGPRDNSWVDPVFASLRRLDRHIGQDIEAQAGSLAAVALACTRSTLSKFVRTAEHGQQRRTENETSHLLIAADEALVGEYAQDLKHRFASVLDSGDVLQLVADVVNDDPIANGIRDAEAGGYEVVFLDGVGNVTSQPDQSSAVALRTISKFVHAESVVIRASVPDHESDWTVAIWQRPLLLVARPAADGTGMGIVYDLKRHGLGALAQGDTREISDCEAEFYMPGRPTPTVAETLLRNAGFDRTGRKPDA